MKNLISIIIPVYNCECYLSDCIESVLEQSYKQIEIILVDDGSSDKSPQICDEFAKKDERVKVLHIDNGGVSNARNVGLSIASGEFFTCVDSDDTIERNYVEVLHNLVKDGKADFGESYENDSDIEEIVKHCGCVNDGEIYYFDRFTSVKALLHARCFTAFAWGKIYKRELLNGLQYDSAVAYGEDFLFNIEYLVKCNRAAFTSKHIYCYRIRETSASRGTLNDKMMTGLDAIDKVREVLKTNFDNDFSVDLYKIVSDLIARLLYMSAGCSWAIRSKFWSVFKAKLKEYYVKDYFKSSLCKNAARNVKIKRWLVQHRLFRLCILVMKLNKKLKRKNGNCS